MTMNNDDLDMMNIASNDEFDSMEQHDISTET